MTGNQVAFDFSPSTGEGIFSFFCPLIVSLRLGYLRAVSTIGCQTICISEIFSSLSILLYSKSINNNRILLVDKNEHIYPSWMSTKCGAWLEIEWPVVHRLQAQVAKHDEIMA